MARSPAPFARSFCCVAVLALLAACGGVSDPFSPSGGAGTFSGSGGSAHAGASNAGGTPAVGAGADGNPAGGSNVAGGISAAGSSSAGSGTSSAGGTSQAGAGSSGGTSASGGAVSGGSAGSLADAGSDDGDDNCQTLLSKASKQLAAAQVCNGAANSDQCTGEVENTCHCQVAVHRVDSDETNAYLATLKLIQAKKCSQVCSALACLPAMDAQCRPSVSGSASGMCVATHALPL